VYSQSSPCLASSMKRFPVQYRYPCPSAAVPRCPIKHAIFLLCCKYVVPLDIFYKKGSEKHHIWPYYVMQPSYVLPFPQHVFGTMYGTCGYGYMCIAPPPKQVQMYLYSRSNIAISYVTPFSSLFFSFLLFFLSTFL
jgi:hypothetical protein